MILLFLIFILLASFAAANGANDVSKGVATLVGSGITRYRTAILWGAAATLAGSLVSGLFAARMLKLFTSEIVAAAPTPAFTLAVIGGAAGLGRRRHHNEVAGLDHSRHHRLSARRGVLYAPTTIAGQAYCRS